MDDGVLAARTGGGDREAFRLLVHRLTPRGLAVATRMLGSRGDGEDALQEAFLRLWRGAERFDPNRGGSLRTWFHRVLVNLCIDAARRRQPHTGLDVVAALPETQRAAVVLCYYEDMSNAEAADALGVTVHALEALLVRGRRTLRRHHMEQEDGKA